MKNSDKIILDLCGGTGAWSLPYKKAGYKVENITLPQFDVLLTDLTGNYITFKNKELDKYRIYKKDVYGILSAPPCTQFSFARTKAKEERNLYEGMRIVRKCLDIIWFCMECVQETKKKVLPLKFWALENPMRGFLPKFLGKPPMIFNPYEFGNMYKKETAIWGNFNIPPSIATKPKTLYSMKKFDSLASREIAPEMFGKLTRQERRSITPAGFAKAFFLQNQ